MEYKIIWTFRAIENYKSILLYLKNEWPNKVMLNFENSLQQKINLLSTFPKLGYPSAKRKGVRSTLITKHNKLFYKVDEDKKEIVILAFFDTRQNPF